MTVTMTLLSILHSTFFYRQYYLTLEAFIKGCHILFINQSALYFDCFSKIFIDFIHVNNFLIFHKTRSIIIVFGDWVLRFQVRGNEKSSSSVTTLVFFLFFIFFIFEFLSLGVACHELKSNSYLWLLLMSLCKSDSRARRV